MVLFSIFPLLFLFYSCILHIAIFCESGVKKMANIKSAEKRIRVIAKKTASNRRVKSHLKGIIKNFDSAIAAGDFDTAKEKLALAEKKLMQAAAKGTIHKNAASRKVSRLTKRFNNAKAE
jgi:small subunit ribosomal protein S20